MHGAKRRISRYGRGPPTTQRYCRRKKGKNNDINAKSTKLSRPFTSKGCRTQRPRVIHSIWVRIPYQRCHHRSHLTAGRRRLKSTTQYTLRPLNPSKYNPLPLSPDLYHFSRNTSLTSQIWVNAHLNHTTFNILDTPSHSENWAPDFIMRIICLIWFCTTAPFICKRFMEFSHYTQENSQTNCYTNITSTYGLQFLMWICRIAFSSFLKASPPAQCLPPLPTANKHPISSIFSLFSSQHNTKQLSTFIQIYNALFHKLYIFFTQQYTHLLYRSAIISAFAIAILPFYKHHLCHPYIRHINNLQRKKSSSHKHIHTIKHQLDHLLGLSHPPSHHPSFNLWRFLKVFFILSIYASNTPTPHHTPHIMEMRDNNCSPDGTHRTNTIPPSTPDAQQQPPIPPQDPQVHPPNQNNQQDELKRTFIPILQTETRENNQQPRSSPTGRGNYRHARGGLLSTLGGRGRGGGWGRGPLHHTAPQQAVQLDDSRFTQLLTLMEGVQESLTKQSARLDSVEQRANTEHPSTYKFPSASTLDGSAFDTSKIGLNFQPHPLKHPIQQHPPTLPSQNLLPNHLPHLHHIHLVPQHMSLLPNQNLPTTPLTHLQAQAWLPSSATSNRRNANEPTVTKRNHPNPPPTHNHLQQPPQDTAKLQST